MTDREWRTRTQVSGGVALKNTTIFPLDVRGILGISSGILLLLRKNLIFSCPPPPFAPPARPQIFCQTISNQVPSFYVRVRTTLLSVFTEPLFMAGETFFFFLSRAAGSSSSQSSRGGEAEPAMEPASQPGSQSLQWSPSYSPEEPIIQERYQTMNHLHQSSPLVPSHRCAHPPSHAALLPGRPPACRCLHL